MAVALEEVFGPVLSVPTFQTHEETIALANSPIYGLSASVWSANVEPYLQIVGNVHTGTVWINTFMDGFSELPFGGYKQSGLGRELGRHSVEDYTEEETIHFHSGARTSWWMPQKR